MTDSIASSLRSRLPKIFTRSSTALSADLSELIRIVRLNHAKTDPAFIEKAYKTAEFHHTGQKRKSGEDYITHPLAVARILADLGSGPATIAAAACGRWNTRQASGLCADISIAASTSGL